jgi:hypothetical protein
MDWFRWADRWLQARPRRARIACAVLFGLSQTGSSLIRSPSLLQALGAGAGSGLIFGAWVYPRFARPLR